MLSSHKTSEVFGETKPSGDIKLEVVISVEQCFHGHVTTLDYTQEYVTPTNLIKTRPASKEVVISAGIPDNHEMRFPGEGHIGLKHHRSDLVVIVKVQRDETWARKGENLIMIYSLTLAQALKAEPLTFKTFSHEGPDQIVNWPVDEIITPRTAIVVPNLGLPVYRAKGEK